MSSFGVPEPTVSLGRQDPYDLPRMAMVDHQLEGAPGRGELTHLRQRGLGPGRVVDHAERVDQVVLPAGNRRRQLLGVRLHELDPVLDPHHARALPRDAQRLAGQVDRRQLGARPGEVDRVGADPATDLEYPLSVPPLKLREPRNVRLHESTSGLDLVEVLARANRLGRVPDVAGTIVPVAADVGDRFGVALRVMHCFRASKYRGSTRDPTD